MQSENKQWRRLLLPQLYTFRIRGMRFRQKSRLTPELFCSSVEVALQKEFGEIKRIFDIEFRTFRDQFLRFSN
jgi:hypothetical protein